jgi:alkylated DNA repair protein alkB family protein 1
MSGHLDDAEYIMSEPIISISLGRSAIFLIGGRSKDVKPVPILIRSGDVVIMSKESRYAYHGVPFIVPFRNHHGDSKGGASPPLSSIMCGTTDLPMSELDCRISENSTRGEGERDHLLEYLRDNRINMNVRRVAPLDNVWREKCGSMAMHASTKV